MTQEQLIILTIGVHWEIAVRDDDWHAWSTVAERLNAVRDYLTITGEHDSELFEGLTLLLNIANVHRFGIGLFQEQAA